MLLAIQLKLIKKACFKFSFKLFYIIDSSKFIW